MAYYRELELLLNSAVGAILNNEDICKLLVYYPQEIDFRYDPLIQPKVENPNELLLKNVFPVPKTPDADLKQNCLITVTVKGGDTMLYNKGFRKVLLVFDIICHLDSWIIKGGYRPLKILSEIDSMFNYKTFNGLEIINLPESRPFRAKEYSTKFYGYQVAYELQLPSNVGC